MLNQHLQLHRYSEVSIGWWYTMFLFSVNEEESWHVPAMPNDTSLLSIHHSTFIEEPPNPFM